MNYWLMKSEPDVYSIDHLARDKTSLWEGVRNYQARNFMTQSMKIGDPVLFYHSNAKPSGIAGVAEVSKSAVPDPLQFDPNSEYYEPKASLEKPIWFCVQVRYIKKFKNLISLEQLKCEKKLKEMMVLKKGQRLSVQPVSVEQFNYIQTLSEESDVPYE